MSQIHPSLAMNEFIAFDLETTGFDPIGSEIVELGAVRFRRDGRVLHTYDQLISPRSRIPDRATRIHGITDRMVAGKPRISAILPDFVDFLGEKPVLMVAHHARFDLRFLTVALRRIGRAIPVHTVIDSCELARRTLPMDNHKLETIGQQLGFIEVAKHRALADAMLLKDVFVHLLHARGGIRTTEQLYRLTPALCFDQPVRSASHPPTGNVLLDQLIAARAPAVICYSGGSTPGAPRTITPLRLVDRQGSTYLSAICHRGGRTKSFRLDRILTVEPADAARPI
jgi:DNA polymerase III epsilon subunit family exonuclease